jgi:hypothetical protein
MKAHRRPEKQPTQPRTLRFFHPRPKNTLSVEHTTSGVIIRAARDNFSQQHKSCFIRYLADEGFIPDRYHWFSEQSSATAPDLEWLVENCCNPADPGTSPNSRHTDNFMVRLIGCALFLWLTEFAILFLTTR